MMTGHSPFIQERERERERERVEGYNSITCMLTDTSNISLFSMFHSCGRIHSCGCGICLLRSFTAGISIELLADELRPGGEEALALAAILEI